MKSADVQQEDTLLRFSFKRMFANSELFKNITFFRKYSQFISCFFFKKKFSLK